MQYLIQRIAANKCKTHHKHIKYISYVQKTIENKHTRRGMCATCIKEKHIKCVSVKKLADHLELFQLPIQALLNHLNELTYIINKDTLKLFNTKSIQDLYFNCRNKSITQFKIDKIGELLSETIRVNRKKRQIRFKLITPMFRIYQCNQLISEVSQQPFANIAIPLILEIKKAYLQIRQLTVRFRHTQTLQLVGDIHDIVLSHNSQLLAISYEDNIALYDVDLNTKKINFKNTLLEGNYVVWKLAFNHNSTILADCGESSQIRIWSIDSNNQWHLTNRICLDAQWITSINFNNLANILISGNFDNGNVRFHMQANSRWKMHREPILGQEPIEKVVLSPDSRFLAIVSPEQLSIYRTPFESQIKQDFQIDDEDGGFSYGIDIAFNQESNRMIIGLNEGKVTIWRLNEVTMLWDLQQTLVNTAFDEIGSVTFNSQSNMIITNYINEKIDVWRLNRQNLWVLNYQLTMNNKCITNSVITQDSTMLISINRENEVYVHVQSI